MSFKEFVPSAQAGSTSSSHDSSMSPTLGKYLERNVEPIPYWSPATRREENSEEYSNITAIVESSSSNQLAISATEFVPSGVSAGAGMLRMQSVNGLNLQAAAWVPPAANANATGALTNQQQQQQQQQGDGGEAYIESQGLDNEGEIEAMVEVSETRLYSTIYSMAYVENITAFLTLNYWSSNARHIIVDSKKRSMIFEEERNVIQCQTLLHRLRGMGVRSSCPRAQRTRTKGAWATHITWR